MATTSATDRYVVLVRRGERTRFGVAPFTDVLIQGFDLEADGRVTRSPWPPARVAAWQASAARWDRYARRSVRLRRGWVGRSVVDRLAPPRPGPDHSIRLRDSVVDYVGDSVVDYVELVNTIAADRRNVVQLGHVSATRR